MTFPRDSSRGVTLVELIVVIAITSIIAAVVAVFIRRPVEGYADAARRAALTDEADTALRRMTRDLRLALPNSVRVSGGFVEYIETTGGGRYRADFANTGPAGNPLDFLSSDPTQIFDVIGPAPSAVGSHVVVYNLYSGGTASNAYHGGNRALVTAQSGATLTITPVVSFPFPEPSPAKRFHVVSGPVTYGCVGGQLLRYWGYAYNAAQVAPPVGGVSAVLAGNVGDCEFIYSANSLTERIATVSIILQINSVAASGAVEQIRMFQQAQVDNAP